MNTVDDFIKYLLMSVEGAYLQPANSLPDTSSRKKAETEKANILLSPATTLQSIVMHAVAYFSDTGARLDVESLGCEYSIKVVKGKELHLIQASINENHILSLEITSTKAFI